jgi:hypothetical protein
MSKKIDDARKHLTKALKKHADIVGSSAVSLKKSQRAAAEVREAALAYAELVTKKTGHPSPFDGLTDHDGLGESTIASLKKEREKLATKPITTIDTKKAS